MKSFKDAMQLGTNINNLCSKIFLKDDPDDMTFSFTIEDNGGEEGDGYSVVFPWCVVDLGWPVDTPTLTGNEQTAGFHVWTGVMKAGNHWEPDYLDDVTICETKYWGTAVQAVLHGYISWCMDNMMQEEYSNDNEEV
jgi:hypothetical protein